jgi:thioredoxin 1
MTVRHIDRATLDELIGAAERAVLVEFTADWCPPCHALAPILDELAAEEQDRLVVAAIDVDAHPDVARRHGVMAMPTLILFVGGEAQRRVVGARSKAQLWKELELGAVPLPSVRGPAAAGLS